MKLLLLLTSAIALPSFAASGDLSTSDLTGVSFWLVSAAMLASTVFFFIERDNVSAKWKTSLTVAGLVTGIAFMHYMYMREVWVASMMAEPVGVGSSPIVFRYVDWLLTVPLLMVEFYLILAACTNVAGSLFKKLLVGSLVMLIAGFIGESNGEAAVAGEAVTGVVVPFAIGMAAWLYMIYELWMGEGKSAVTSASPAVNSAYNTMMWIVIVGWAIYPLGYASGYLMEGGINPDNLNLIYNLADFVNKILFGLIIWHVAVKESASA